MRDDAASKIPGIAREAWAEKSAGADGDVAFFDVCLRLYELPQITAHFMASGDCDGDSRADLILDNASAQAVSVVYVSTTNEITSNAIADL